MWKMIRMPLNNCILIQTLTYMCRNFKMAWIINIKHNKKVELRFQRGDHIKIFFQGNSMNFLMVLCIMVIRNS